MKKKTETVKALAILAALGLILTGCGGSKMSAEATTDDAAACDTASYATGDIYSYDTAEASAEEYEMDEGGSQAPEVQDTARKLIRNVDLQVETEEFDNLLSTISKRTESLSGYIEESYTYNGSTYYGRGNRSASLTIRIPADRLDDFLSEISEVSNVISRNESITDVTLQYVDMESHKKALLAEQERLLELIEQAENVEDIITIESRLSEVRYQLESMESQLRTMDNQVSYSTIYLSIEEVKQYTPVAEQSIGEKIVTGFTGSLKDVGVGLMNFVIGIIINLPYLVFWAVVILIVVLIIRAVIRRKRNGKQRKIEKLKGMSRESEKSLETTVKEEEKAKNE
ncbi:MAG: DUF4349 domain-containing protein [Bacillota bacterium]|nr:DUF4349 domain-containing protein [Bacillota bacterium]